MQGVAVVVVRNTASHDARILRCSKVLQALGYETTVVAVTSDEEGTKRAEVAGVPILRLTPRAPRFVRAVKALAVRVAGSAVGSTQAGASGKPGAPSAPNARAAHPRRGAAPGTGLAERLYRLMGTLDYYRQGIGAMRALRPALVHCNDYNTTWIGIGAKLLAGSALVYDSHELWPDRNGRREPRWWLMACEALFVRVADRLLATSPGHSAVIGHRYRVTPPQVIRNIPERSTDSELDVAGGGDRESRSLVYVGAVTSHRGLEQAIEALTHAPGVVLRIIGPGRREYRAALAGLAEKLSVEGRVRLEEPVPPGDVVETIAAGSCAGLALIQPACLSYELSLPNKIFEYLAAGLPILAADLPVIGAFTEEHGCGLTVSPSDPVAIGEAMLEIADPERNRELRGAAEEAASRISWEQEAAVLGRIYREAGRSSFAL